MFTQRSLSSRRSIRIFWAVAWVFLGFLWMTIRARSISLGVRLDAPRQQCEAMLSSTLSSIDIAAFKKLVSIVQTYGPKDDQTIKTLFEEINPTADESTTSLTAWHEMFTSCTIKDGNGKHVNLLVGLFKRGLENSIKAFYANKFVTEKDYVAARDTEDNNLFHLAVLAQKPGLLTHVTYVLRDHTELVEGDSAKNVDGKTPRELARLLDSAEILKSLKVFWNFNHNAQDQSRGAGKFDWTHLALGAPSTPLARPAAPSHAAVQSHYTPQSSASFYPPIPKSFHPPTSFHAPLMPQSFSQLPTSLHSWAPAAA